jgi:hypothetical protein
VGRESGLLGEVAGNPVDVPDSPTGIGRGVGFVILSWPRCI